MEDARAEIELQLEGAAECITYIQREISVAEPLGRRHKQNIVAFVTQIENNSGPVGMLPCNNLDIDPGFLP